MPHYTRASLPGGTFFFTVVTYRRRRFLTLPESRQALRHAVMTARRTAPFTIDAWVLLPDHLHCIWTLPAGDTDFPRRWNIIKAGFSRLMKDRLHCLDRLTTSRLRHRELTIWQRRYWEHQIRDDADFQRHVDYIHWNPVKHGLVRQAADWPYSTFRRFVEREVYPQDWCGGDERREDAGFGE